MTYDPSWPERFLELEALVRATVGEHIVQLDHIGSTSVPGLAAKDVIDVQATVASLAATDSWPAEIGPLRRRHDINADHVPPGQVPGRGWQKRYWASRSPGAHLHVREQGRPNQRYALLFRDYLRSHPTAAAAYQQAKRRLAALCEDTAAYADAKDPVCDLVLHGAEAWAAATGWGSRSPGDVLRRMVEVFNSGDVGGVGDLVHDDYVDHQGLGHGPLHGPSGLVEVVEAARLAYGHLSVTVEDVIASNDRTAGRLRWRGTQPDAHEVDRKTIEIVRTAEGRAIEHWGGRS